MDQPLKIALPVYTHRHMKGTEQVSSRTCIISNDVQTAAQDDDEDELGKEINNTVLHVCRTIRRKRHPSYKTNPRAFH